MEAFALPEGFDFRRMDVEGTDVIAVFHSGFPDEVLTVMNGSMPIQPQIAEDTCDKHGVYLCIACFEMRMK